MILGPTASGKSALSLQLAQLLHAEIISLDSALVYRGMDVGTAKPSKEELAICPHHLIDICDPSESYSAANFRRDCIRLVGEIRARGALPIICGGTMMYYKALVDGLSSLPETTAEVRAQVQAMADAEGWPQVHARLEQIDPPLYRKLAPRDKQRVARALEVYLMTGRPMSSYFAEKKDQCPFSRLELVLLPQNPDRTHLRELIRQRFLAMLEHGLLEETQALLDQGIDDQAPAMRAVGYRQVAMYLRGEVSYEQMVELGVIATARLAKHQMTWLRGGLKASAKLSTGEVQVTQPVVNTANTVNNANSAPTSPTTPTAPLAANASTAANASAVAGAESGEASEAAASGEAAERHYFMIEDEHKLERVCHLLQQHPMLWAYAQEQS